MGHANIEDARAYKRQWYAKNQTKVTAENMRRKKKTKDWFDAYKATLSCTCGENHSSCLDFHHLDPTKKDLEVAKAVNNGWSIRSLKREIAKCIVLCANCHRKLHWAERNA